jgi:hypothetical protein
LRLDCEVSDSPCEDDSEKAFVDWDDAELGELCELFELLERLVELELWELWLVVEALLCELGLLLENDDALDWLVDDDVEALLWLLGDDDEWELAENPCEDFDDWLDRLELDELSDGIHA